ncbi:MAG: glucose-1-phosphate adenylyltransferase, partial [Anaerovibrio sp.]|nr:glucose-1-phosphate adenylyltransferase [Anaerovibrio sp.]
SHDFGKNIIPNMLKNDARIFSYKFEGYWKDVGTIESLWQANMDLLQEEPPFSINSSWNIYSANPSLPPHFVGMEADISRSMINEGSMILGKVSHSVLSSGVKIGRGAKVTNSVIMPFAVIEENAVVDHAIVAQNSVISARAQVLGEPGAIAVVPEGETVEAVNSGQQVS